MIRAACILAALAAVAASAAPPAPSPAERAAIFKAAGFKPRGAQFVRCADDASLSYMPGRIELADLNGDGRPEAWITESSLFCYGNTAEAVVLLTKDAGGQWRKLLDEVGVALPLKTTRGGWPDLEVGGPGLGAQPQFRWDGSRYVRAR